MRLKSLTVYYRCDRPTNLSDYAHITVAAGPHELTQKLNYCRFLFYEQALRQDDAAQQPVKLLLQKTTCIP